MSMTEQSRLVANIQKTLRTSAALPCDAQGYVSRPEENLLPGVSLDQFKEDLSNGGGRELERKFLAVHSSSALAVNSFCPFKNHPEALTVLGRKGFTHLSFEKQLPTGLKGTPPNLDVFLTGNTHTVAIESKFLEYLTPKKAEYSASYVRDRFPYAESSWWDVVEESKQGGVQHLDVAQLVKHYLGLKTMIDQGRQTGTPASSVCLVYLYWEPVNWMDLSECRAHREEIMEFSEKVSDAQVTFLSLSYLDLWREWEAIPAFVEHVQRLQTRYRIAVEV